MSKILKVSQSDYRVVVRSGGIITLDTGANIGIVRVTGNLVVEGDYTTINVSDMQVEDNIILLNKGETGTGVTERTSGIEIDRGQADNALFLFDEDIDHWDPLTLAYIPGTFTLKTADGKLSGIQVAVISNDGNTDIVFDLQSGQFSQSVSYQKELNVNVLSLASIDADTYANQLFLNITRQGDIWNGNDNMIPNRRYLTRYVAASGGMADVDRVYYNALTGVVKTKIQTYEFDIKFTFDGIDKITANNSGLFIDHVKITDDTITNTTTGVSAKALTLESDGKDYVEVNSALSLTDRGTLPSPNSGRTKIYSTSSVGPGKSGLYFTNVNNTDELIAKNRALLFSMIF